MISLVDTPALITPAGINTAIPLPCYTRLSPGKTTPISTHPTIPPLSKDSAGAILSNLLRSPWLSCTSSPLETTGFLRYLPCIDRQSFVRKPRKVSERIICHSPFGVFTGGMIGSCKFVYGVPVTVTLGRYEFFPGFNGWKDTVGSKVRGQHAVGMSRPLEWSFLLDQARWVPHLATYPSNL